MTDIIENKDRVLGKMDEYTVMYTEEYNTICSKCCLSSVCLKEGYCKCDGYRFENDLNLEGDIYFVKNDD